MAAVQNRRRRHRSGTSPPGLARHLEVDTAETVDQRYFTGLGVNVHVQPFFAAISDLPSFDFVTSPDGGSGIAISVVARTPQCSGSVSETAGTVFQLDPHTWGICPPA